MSAARNIYGIPRFARAASGHLDFDTSQTTVTLQTAKTTAYRIFITDIIVWIKTDAAQSITFQDTAATPLVLGKVPVSPGIDSRWEFPFTDRGYPLTLGKDLTATFSGAGLAGSITWTGYQTNKAVYL